LKSNEVDIMKTEEIERKLATYKRGYAKVDLDAILYNMQQMHAHIAEGTQMMGVIKADGYGHGSVPIARCLQGLDYLFGFAVATAEEAHLLRLAGIQKPILLLGYAFPYSYKTLAEEQIRPALFRYDMVEKLNAAARENGEKMKVHIKVDTGMSRIGITPDEEGLRFVEYVATQEFLEIEGIFTHFARADEVDKTPALRQLECFTKFVSLIEERLHIKIPIKHCSNSAGIMELSQANLNMVRAGISLYGLYPSEEVKRDTIDLKPALSLHSHIVYIKTIHAGQAVSYGGTFVAPRDMRVATVPLGYGDGYPRSLSGRGYVLIHGERAPILGRVCMDQFMVDISHIENVKEDDPVVLIGFDGKEQISAEQIGELSGRFNYELVCDLNQRLPRVYLQDKKVVDVRDELS